MHSHSLLRKFLIHLLANVSMHKRTYIYICVCICDTLLHRFISCHKRQLLYEFPSYRAAIMRSVIQYKIVYIYTHILGLDSAFNRKIYMLCANNIII